MIKFQECSVCAVKPGSPVLCNVCLYNRDVASTLNALVNKLEECHEPITNAFHMAFDIRGQQYSGPNYAKELAAAKALDDSRK